MAFARNPSAYNGLLLQEGIQGHHEEARRGAHQGQARGHQGRRGLGSPGEDHGSDTHP